jgi:hypothetical protein
MVNTKLSAKGKNKITAGNSRLRQWRGTGLSEIRSDYLFSFSYAFNLKFFSFFLKLALIIHNFSKPQKILNSQKNLKLKILFL